MKVFALSDPHYGRDMSRFGEVWINHEAEIRRRWARRVGPRDLVLIPGDFSWATTTKSIERHLDEVNGLAGRKVISPGNHDKWWRKSSRLRYSEIRFLADDHLPLGSDWTLAATMGQESPESPWWKEEMRESFEEACRNLEGTLERASRERPGTRILLMIHYPPRWDHDRTPTAFEKIINRHPVALVVYGHIHGQDLRVAHNGDMQLADRSVRYENASCDRTAMEPIEVLELDLDDPPY